MENELRFEWDPRKAAANRAKHGVSFEEASSVFGDPLGLIVDDPRHSHGEERHVLLGSSEGHRLLAVMFTGRGEMIRVISARKVTRWERKSYEEQQD
ncbi:MAG: BrnT family toxin [Acidobacteriia bacterium]|nr:BrnT family toxin [Terriglobia bacterium]